MEFRNLSHFKGKLVAGLFLSQSLDHGIETLINFGEERNAIVFSPFEGDVEKGVPCGLSVTDIVQPYLNIKALISAQIQLKKFFMRVAMYHDK